MSNASCSSALLLIALLAGGAPAWGQTNGTMTGTASSEAFTLTAGSGTGLCTAGFNPEPRATVTSPLVPGGVVAVRVNLCGSPPGQVLTWRILDRPRACFAAVDNETPYNALSVDQYRSTTFVMADKVGAYVVLRFKASDKPVCTVAGQPPASLEAFYGDLRRNPSLARAPLGALHWRVRLGPGQEPVL